jgi:hypothetical protein
MTHRRALCAVLLVAAFLPLFWSPSAGAWGDEGHRWINQVAAARLPSDMPAFFRNAGPRLSFLGPEPDRWRDNKELYSALREVNGPDHFINIDRPQNFDELPNDRYKYSDWLRTSGKEPSDIGFLPYSILEGYQKIQVLFRLWRDPQHAAEREQIEQNIIFYAGVVGHYVADGAQPLHTTNHFNGWSSSSNPDLNTREPLHWRFEGEYVKAQLKPEDFDALVKPAQRLPDPFSDIMKYLLDSHSQVGKVYELDKAARWNDQNRNPASKRFVAGRLAAGSQMLANLWYTAWTNSAR